MADYVPYTFTYTSSGSAVVNIPFAFLDRTHVKVYFNSVLKTVNVDYSWLSNGQIRILTATFGQQVKIARETPAQPIVQFQAGAVIPISDLNVAMLQALYRTEELVLESTTSVAYADLVGIPTTFPPAAHNHDGSVINAGTVGPAFLGTGTRDGTRFLRDDGTWQLPPSASGSWGAISGALGDQADLQAALDGKAAVAHSHTISNVTNLQSSLDAKLNASQASSVGLSVLGSSSAHNARLALGIYVQSTDPGNVPAGSLWIY